MLPHLTEQAVRLQLHMLSCPSLEQCGCLLRWSASPTPLSCSADGSVNLDRSNACYDTVSRIVVKVVDTCPCVGNEKWCCGDSGLQHFDLAAGAFARLAPQV